MPRLVTWLSVCAAVACWIDLGSLHQLQHADSLIAELMSLQRWTPYCWEMDRYGMLVALLAVPVRDPFGNLLVQGFLGVFGGLAAFFLLARFVVRDASYPAVGAIGAAAFLARAPAAYRFDYLIDADHGVWLSLGLAGLIAAEPSPAGCRGRAAWWSWG